MPFLARGHPRELVLYMRLNRGCSPVLMQNEQQVANFCSQIL